MFGLFKKKNESEVLQEKHKELLKKAFETSKVNRQESDRLMAQAEEIAKKIDSLKKG
jgi:hypothetical protein